MLKGDMLFDRAASAIEFYMAEEAEQGIIVCYPDGTSVLPPALDSAVNVAVVPTGTDGVPAGILMDTVVDIDRTKYTLFESKRQVALDTVNGTYPKVEVIRNGWFITNKLDTGSTPAVGDPAHFIAGGLFSTTATSAVVGLFESVEGSDGYVRVRVKV